MGQKSPSLTLCRTSSQLTFTETEYYQNEITTLYEKLRELTTEMNAINFFVIEQTLFVKNSVNDKFDNNTQLEEKSNKKYLTGRTHHLIEENKTKNLYNSNTNGKSK